MVLKYGFGLCTRRISYSIYQLLISLFPSHRTGCCRTQHCCTDVGEETTTDYVTAHSREIDKRLEHNVKEQEAEEGRQFEANKCGS